MIRCNVNNERVIRTMEEFRELISVEIFLSASCCHILVRGGKKELLLSLCTPTLLPPTSSISLNKVKWLQNDSVASLTRPSLEELTATIRCISPLAWLGGCLNDLTCCCLTSWLVYKKHQNKQCTHATPCAHSGWGQLPSACWKRKKKKQVSQLMQDI